MSVYNLPPLDSTGLTEPDRPGVWTPLADLDRLAGALRIEGQDLRAVDIKSIPDAWAQIQLASDALLDPSHDAHADVKAQWRGLLALFALQPMYRSEYSLKVHNFEISSAPGAGQSAPWRSRLHRVLNELVPQSAICGLGWSNIGVIDFVPARNPKSGHRSLGMLSPLTLVAPGRTSSAFTHTLPWLSNGLIDPLTATGLRPEAWDILVQYLGGVIESVTRARGPAQERVDDAEKLLSQLRSFQSECEQRASGATELRAEEISADWPDPFFRALGKSAVAQIGTTSDCLLRPRPGQAGQLFTGVILADPAIAESLGKSANEIRVWKEHTLLEAGQPDRLDALKAEAEQEGYLIITPDDLFTTELVRMKQGASVTAHPSSFRDKLLPLSPLALLFAAGRSLSESVQLEAHGEALGVSLAVEVGSTDRPLHHQVRKRFEPAAVVEMRPPDDLALWPDFQDEKWPWNFLRYQYQPMEDLQIRFALSGDMLARDIAGDPRAKASRIAQWGDSVTSSVENRLFGSERTSMVLDGEGKPLLDRVRFVDTPRLVAEQHQIYRGVEAIYFSRRKGTSDIPVGCVAVSRRQVAPTEAAAVSIDFGTSNTVAYFKSDGRPAERLELKNRVVFPIEHKGDTGVLVAAYADFFPLEAHDTPIPTVMKRRDFGGNLTPQLRSFIENVSHQNVADAANRTRAIHALTHILFLMPRIGQTVSPEHLVGQIRSGLLQFDLKWDESSEASFVVSSYLRQLMVLICAELTEFNVRPGRVEWRFSFPQAFNREHADRFRGVVNNIVGQIRDEVGEADSLAANFMTEGEAAATYFSEDESQRLQGVSQLLLMLDIGGGTTDMAIRSDRKLIWRGSVKIAGSDFFRRYLVNNIAILEAVDPESVAHFKALGDAGSDADRQSSLRQLVDLLIAKPSFGAAFQSQYNFHASEPEWRGLRQCAAAALGGMMHYLGLVMDQLIAEGSIPPERLENLSIALGGRGSTIFRQFGVSGSDQTELARLCRLVAPPAGPSTPTPHVLPHFSARPKEEVARGLLIERTGQEETSSPPSRTMPVGLGVSVKKEGASQLIGPSEEVRALVDAETVERIDMADFASFLQKLDTSTGLVIDISGDADRAIRQAAQNQLGTGLAGLRALSAGQNRGRDFDTQLVEPPFITALRALIELMSSPIRERDARLQVWQRD